MTPSLRDLQRCFGEAMLAEGQMPDIALANGVAFGHRITIYRNNMLSNYRNALGASYPVVCRLVGKPFFDAAVDAFVRACPSIAGDLNHYGADFGTFLASYPYAKELRYLGDVARLEWAIDESARAADCQLDVHSVTAALTAVSPERLPTIVFDLDPTCRLVASDFPVLHIWRVNQADYGGDMCVDLDAGPDRLLVRRDGGAVSIVQIHAASFAWLAALADHKPLGEALDDARSVDQRFDLGDAFGTYIGNGTIVGVA